MIHAQFYTSIVRLLSSYSWETVTILNRVILYQNNSCLVGGILLFKSHTWIQPKIIRIVCV